VENLIGIIPAAGKGTRFFSTGWSKELAPIVINDDTGWMPVSDFIVERMMLAGVEDIRFLISADKTDIQEYYNDQTFSFVVRETNREWPKFIALMKGISPDDIILMGFPDTIWYPKNGFTDAIQMLKKKDFDIVVGAFPIEHPEHFGRIELEGDKVVRILDKSTTKVTGPALVWGFVVFKGKAIPDLMPLFYQSKDPKGKMGVVKFKNGAYLDTGTIPDYVTASEFVRRNEGKNLKRIAELKR
jgi:dTDP-glucose pyrophosphorylase